ncbi:MAG: DeoR/GlpR transcriptional regulator, partial [Erysipelotrichaceae bacterium]|nr:DeoR/GlpR transcriptional regulator [Erysipelotrichaceae bacterium]
MKKQDRWNEILNIIKIKKEVTVEELAQEFNTSLATIRRDLLEMEENSMITRFHGGARYNTTRLSEPPMMLKSETNAHAK